MCEKKNSQLIKFMFFKNLNQNIYKNIRKFINRIYDFTYFLKKFIPLFTICIYILYNK